MTAPAALPCVFASGSCRVVTSVADGRGLMEPVHSMARNFRGRNFLTKLHTPRQHLQLFRWLREELELSDEEQRHFLTVRSHFCAGGGLSDDPEASSAAIREAWGRVDAFVCEVCSLKDYSTAKPGGALQQCEMRSADAEESVRSEAELLSDLLELVDYLSPRPVLFVCHFRPHLYGLGEPVDSRETIHRALSQLQAQRGVPFLDPSALIVEHGPERMLSDPLHWSQEGHERMCEAIHKAVAELVRFC